MALFEYVRASRRGLLLAEQERQLREAGVPPTNIYRNVGVWGACGTSSRKGWRALSRKLDVVSYLTESFFPQPARGLAGPWWSQSTAPASSCAALGRPLRCGVAEGSGRRRLRTAAERKKVVAPRFQQAAPKVEKVGPQVCLLYRVSDRVGKAHFNDGVRRAGSLLCPIAEAATEAVRRTVDPPSASSSLIGRCRLGACRLAWGTPDRARYHRPIYPALRLGLHWHRS